jgi:N-acetylglucosaminyl-diphospho-decaprenol L-rhamnosyltransferase
MNAATTASLLPRPLPQSVPPREQSAAVPFLSVVIVNHCRWSETAQLVEQIESSSAFRRGQAEVMIVDNHSPAHPLASRFRRRPGVSLRRWGRNHGFAKAANEGCRLSRGEWFLLLNPDVTMSAGFLEAVVRRAEELSREEPRVGIVGFGLRNEDGSLQRSAGPFPSLMGTIARLALPRARRKYHWNSPAGWASVPWVSGCCLLARGECFRDLGGFDEDFFLYYEDVDLCRRAAEHGWIVCHDPAIRVTHHNPLHRRDVPPHLRLFTRHSLLAYGSKHWPRWQLHVLAGLVRAEAWFQRQAARHRGRADNAEVFGQLQILTDEMVEGKTAAARKRLNRIVRLEEKQRVG